MQYTVEGGYECVVFDGLLADEAVAAVTGGEPPAAVRLVMTAGEPGCSCGGGAVPTLVAVSPRDPAVPPAQRPTVATLGPGRCVADVAWRHLVGASVALTGGSVRVTGAADLAPDSSASLSPSSTAAHGGAGGGVGRAPGPLLLALADVVASLARTALTAVPAVRTVVVMPRGHQAPTPPGWSRLLPTGPWVPLMAGAGGSR